MPGNNNKNSKEQKQRFKIEEVDDFDVEFERKFNLKKIDDSDSYKKNEAPKSDKKKQDKQSLKDTLKVLREFVEKSKDGDNEKLKKSNKCDYKEACDSTSKADCFNQTADCVEASNEPCDAPELKAVFTNVFTGLPRNLSLPISPNIITPTLTATAITTILNSLTVTLATALASNGSDGNDVIETSLETFAAGTNINTTGQFAALPYLVADPLRYFIKLPSDSSYGPLEIEWPLTWMISSLIAQLSNRTSSSRFGISPAVPLTGLVNINTVLEIDPQGKQVKDFADSYVNQNTSGPINSHCICDTAGNVQVDYNFYFLVLAGAVVGGYVLFGNSHRNYLLLNISATSGSVLRPDRFLLSIPVISTGSFAPAVADVPTLLGLLATALGVTVSVSGSTGAITFNNLPMALDLTTFTALTAFLTSLAATSNIGVAINISGAPAVSLASIPTPVTVTSIKNSDGVVTIFITAGSGILVTITINTNIGSAGIGSTGNSTITTVVSLASLPVFSPAILLKFIASSEGDCNKSWILVNETKFNA